MSLSALPALTAAAAGATRRLGLLTRPGPLAAMVLGTAAALLAALAPACAAEPISTPPPALTPTIPATPPSAPSTPPPAIPLVQIAVGRYGQCGLPQDGRAVCTHLLQPPTGLADAQFRQVTAGQNFACGLRLDGALACWGDALHSKTTPPPGKFTVVSAGKQHACALDPAGYAQCWGWNKDGRATPPAGVAFTAIAAGGVHSCGLTDAGALHCWGSNGLGQAENHSGPFQSLSVGARHTCALRPEGTAWCQGDASAGQSRPPPGAFTQIAAGEWHTCGLRPGGRTECWGGGFGAALAEPTGEFTALSGGWNNFCALAAGGYPRCWRYLPDSPQLAEPIAEFSAAAAAPALRLPVELFPWPGGGLAVVERAGIILCLSDVQSQCAAETPPLLDLTARTDLSAPEGGMLSAALDPNFDRFPFLYIWYTVRDNPRKARLSRFPVADGRVDPAGELVILEQPMPNSWHLGGAIRFGPDGMLYLGLGENQLPEEAQSLESLRGKIIRIDVRGAAPEKPYRIPADNPFQDMNAARPEIWAYGLRNPWRMAFDADGLLWVGDVGEHEVEEISIVRAGANLGWPLFEGNRCYRGYAEEAQCAALTNHAPPLAAYGREDGCAIIWGGQYRGAAVPQLAGAYIFGDYCSGRVWALTPDRAGGWQRWLVAVVSSPITSFGADAAGEMYALAVNRPPLKLGPLLPAVTAAENPAAKP